VTIRKMRGVYVPMSKEHIDLECVRELYDGMAIVIKRDGRISEFLEYILRDLAGNDVTSVSLAVQRAHERLGLSQ
jgi:hypothetical protein